MAAAVKEFGSVAVRLSRNPLGIIALFIVLVYGIAALVTLFSGSLTPAERIPLIYFLVGFPVLVLLVFSWLVSVHSGKLFAPSDFRDEENYVRAVASLTAAKAQKQSSEFEIQNVIDAVQSAPSVKRVEHQSWLSQILWVDDRPYKNTYERQAFEAVGISFTFARSTAEALAQISERKFAVIISDMGRQEGPLEGLSLLDAVRTKGIETPFIVYTGTEAPKHEKSVLEHHGQGCTDNPQKLFAMVMSELSKAPS